MGVELLYTVLAPILTTAVSALCVFLIRLVNRKSIEIKSKTQNDQYDKYIDYASSITEQVVLAVSQTYVDTLKSKNAFTKEKQEEAFNKAKSQILLLLTAQSRDVISDLYGDLDSWIDSRIEAEVKKQKLEPKVLESVRLITSDIEKLNS